MRKVDSGDPLGRVNNVSKISKEVIFAVIALVLVASVTAASE